MKKVLQYHSNQKLKSNNVLMQFAGILASTKPDKMMLIIKNDRRNKTEKIKL